MTSTVSGYVAPVTTELEFGTRKGQVTGERWYSCGVCGYWFPEGDFQLFEGKRYCKQHDCYEDIEGIIEQRLEKRNIPRDEERRTKI